LADIGFAQWPKVELHLHIEGAIPFPALWTLVEKYGIDPEVPTVEALASRSRYRDFEHSSRPRSGKTGSCASTRISLSSVPRWPATWRLRTSSMPRRSTPPATPGPIRVRREHAHQGASAPLKRSSFKGTFLDHKCCCRIATRCADRAQREPPANPF
jgi:hypothetical protein